MAFDISNPADLLALKNEVNNDPLGMGYLSSGNTDDLLDLLNDSVGNLSPVNGAASMTSKALLNAIFAVPVGAADQFKIQLLFEAGGGLDSDLSDFKAKVKDLSTALVDAVNTIIRPLSRAEALFSVDDNNGVKEFVTITKADWIAARDS